MSDIEFLLKNYNLFRTTRNNLQRILILMKYKGKSQLNKFLTPEVTEVINKGIDITSTQKNEIKIILILLDVIIHNLEDSLEELNETEYNIIKSFYFEDMKWYEIEKEINECQRNCQRKRKKAIEQIEKTYGMDVDRMLSLFCRVNQL